MIIQHGVVSQKAVIFSSLFHFTNMLNNFISWSNRLYVPATSRTLKLQAADSSKMLLTTRLYGITFPKSISLIHTSDLLLLYPCSVVQYIKPLFSVSIILHLLKTCNVTRYIQSGSENTVLWGTLVCTEWCRSYIVTRYIQSGAEVILSLGTYTVGQKIQCYEVHKYVQSGAEVILSLGTYRVAQKL